jgi:hypothetical protein
MMRSGPNAPPERSPGACAAMTAQFLVRSLEGGNVATDLGSQSLIEMIQTGYESQSLANHEADPVLLQQSGLDIVRHYSLPNNAFNWSHILNDMLVNPGAYYASLENTDADGHVIGFFNDGRSLYYIDPNEGIFELGQIGAIDGAAVANYLAIQHDQESIHIHDVAAVPVPGTQGWPDTDRSRWRGP